MAMAGQTINDRLLAARHSLAGQGLAKSVCKATTEECIGPKLKHLDYLVHCTNEPNVSIPHLANLLIERSQNSNWVVVYKALITTHHLMAYGNERFMQYLASSNSTFNLSSFLDKGGVQGKEKPEFEIVFVIDTIYPTCGMAVPGGKTGYDMSPFIRRYAKYLNEKSLAYRAMAFDFCKVKRGKEEGSLRTMNADKLLKTLPVLQAQLDALLEFDCQANDLRNDVINMSFLLLFRDLIRLFACYNDGIINLLEKYFDMNKKLAREGLELYKKFLVRMDRVGEFLKVAENIGIEKGDIPDLTKAPSSLLDALEQHLATLEGRKLSAANTPTQAASSNQKNVKSAVSVLSSTSSSFGNAAASSKFDTSNGIDEQLKAQALAEEEAVLNQYKSKLSSPTSSGVAGANAALTNPFLSSPPAASAGATIVDLFSAASAQPGTAGSAAAVAPTAKASDDLLQLGNPFADMFDVPITAAAAGSSTLSGANSGFNGTSASSAAANAFVSDSNFSSVFGNAEPTDCGTASTSNPFFDSMDPNASQSFFNLSAATAIPNANLNVMMPSKAFSNHSPAIQNHQHPNVNSNVMDSMAAKANAAGILLPTGGGAIRDSQQQQQQQPPAPASGGKLLTGDLDTSLMSLVENLNINKSSNTKPVQWNSPKNTAKPGANWTPQPMAATTGAGYRPMAHGMTVSPAPITINHPFVHATYPVIPNYMQQGMPVMGQPMMGQAPLTGATSTMAAPMMMPSNPVVSMPPPPSALQTIQPNATNYANPRRQ